LNLLIHSAAHAAARSVAAVIALAASDEPGLVLGLPTGRTPIPVYEELSRFDTQGGLDLVFLGVGADGHVAYNLPGPPQATTHQVLLPPDLAESLEVPEDWRPLRALTMGLETLLSARHLVMLAVGEAKAKAVRALVEGPETPEWPCSLLRGHDRLDVVLDLAAAGGERLASRHIMPRG